MTGENNEGKQIDYPALLDDIRHELRKVHNLSMNPALVLDAIDRAFAYVKQVTASAVKVSLIDKPPASISVTTPLPCRQTPKSRIRPARTNCLSIRAVEPLQAENLALSVR